MERLLDEVAWMADAGHLRPGGDEPGGEWHDWNCQLAPRAPDADPEERSRRFNPNHGEDGKFSSGSGVSAHGVPYTAAHDHGTPTDAAPHGLGVQPYRDQRNPPTHDSASTADGHDIRSEVPGVGHYDRYRGDVVHGVPIPALTDKQHAAIARRLAATTAPPKGAKAPETWKGREEGEVVDRVLSASWDAARAHADVTAGKDDDVREYLTTVGYARDRRAYARGLAFARGTIDAIDAKVKDGTLTRAFEDGWDHANTRLRQALVKSEPSP